MKTIFETVGEKLSKNRIMCGFCGTYWDREDLDNDLVIEHRCKK